MNIDAFPLCQPAARGKAFSFFPLRYSLSWNAHFTLSQDSTA